MAKTRKRRVTVTLAPSQIKRLDRLIRKWWPGLTPSTCRSVALKYLVDTAAAAPKRVR